MENKNEFNEYIKDSIRNFDWDKFNETLGRFKSACDSILSGFEDEEEEKTDEKETDGFDFSSSYKEWLNDKLVKSDEYETRNGKVVKDEHYDATKELTDKKACKCACDCKNEPKCEEETVTKKEYDELFSRHNAMKDAYNQLFAKHEELTKLYAEQNKKIESLKDLLK